MKKDFWQGKCYGYHADLHLNEHDVQGGENADPDLLYEQMKALNPDWVQIDSKGHPGYCSWFSKVPTASVAPTLKKDTVMAWRIATERLGVPCICHYSGFIDDIACRKHPEWQAISPKGANGRFRYVCPRSSYFEELMIPEIAELFGDYRIDGVWLDGDVWGNYGCWCPACKKAFAEKTGITEIPTDDGAPYWQEWCRFFYDVYAERANKTMAALRSKFPDKLICVNWLGSFTYPDTNGIDSDWYSGDCSPVYAVDQIRREAPFLSCAGKSWDLMSWPYGFNGAPGCDSLNLYIKPVEALQQEAAFILAYGGKWICCNAASGVRSARQVDWHMPRLRRVGEFMKERYDVAFNTEPVYDVSVFRSENIKWGNRLDEFPGQTMEYGATCSAELMLMALHYSVTAISEKNMTGTGGSSKVIVLSERENPGAGAVEQLKRYVSEGGRLIVTGLKNAEKFGLDYFGVQDKTTVTEYENAGITHWVDVAFDKRPRYFVSDGEDGVAAIESDEWTLIGATLPQAVRGETVYGSYFPEESATPYPAWVTMPHGAGTATWIPFDLFTYYLDKLMMPAQRDFLGRVVASVYPERLLDLKAPKFVNGVLRQKENTVILHLLNGATGVSGSNRMGLVVEDIPPVYGLEAELRLQSRPVSAVSLPDRQPLAFTATPEAEGFRVCFTLPKLDIHTAVQLTF